MGVIWLWWGTVGYGGGGQKGFIVVLKGRGGKRWSSFSLELCSMLYLAGELPFPKANRLVTELRPGRIDQLDAIRLDIRTSDVNYTFQ
jgi:hypothetical protein